MISSRLFCAVSSSAGGVKSHGIPSLSLRVREVEVRWDEAQVRLRRADTS